MKEKQIEVACSECLHHFACLVNSEYVPTPCQAYEEKANRKQSEGEDTNVPTKWISVEERLPEKSGKYLVCTKNSNVYQTKFYSYPENVGGHWGQKDKGNSITNWMPLPDAPKGENNG